MNFIFRIYLFFFFDYSQLCIYMKLSIKKSDFKFIKDRFMFLFRRESCKRPEGTVSINETAEMRSVQCSCKPRSLYSIIKNTRNILIIS